MTHPLAALLAGVPRIETFSGDAVMYEKDVFSALSAAPVEVRVKPLEWEPSVIGKPWHSAKAPWGWYYAQWDEETQAWFASLELGEVEAPIILDPSDVPTIEEAKAAAQADYEARIMAALEVAHHVNETPKSEHDSADVLTALPADVAGVVDEAGKIADRIESHMGKANIADVLRDCRQAADTIRALIALAAAQAAQIAGLEAEVTYWRSAGDGHFNQAMKNGATANQERTRAEAAATALAAERAKVAKLVEALVEHNDLLRSAFEIAKREGVKGKIASTNWDAYYNRVAVVLKRHHQTANDARAALSEKEGRDG